MRYLPAGLSLAIEPAGEMWSVVTESPNAPRQRAPRIGWIGPGCGARSIEERRLLDVGAVGIPVVELAFAGFDGVPFGVLVPDVAVLVLRTFRAARIASTTRLHFGVRRPDVAQIDGRAVRAGADGLRFEVDVGRAGEGVGDDERRAGQVVGFHIGVDAAFEVAVAGEDAGDDEVVFLDGLGDRLGQRAAVADAGGAAVADGVEADLFEVGVEAGFLEVVGDDARAGGEAGLHVRRDGEAFFDGFLGEQAGGDHHARVAGVRAAGDGGDDDVAVFDVESFVVPLDGNAAEAGVGCGGRWMGGVLWVRFCGRLRLPSGLRASR